MEGRVLVVGPSWVGDMVMAQTLFKSLVSTRPGVVIDVMAPAAALAVVERMPEVNKAILFDVGHGELRLSYRWQFAKSLRAKSYQQVILLPNSAKSALVPLFAGIKRRTGFLGEHRYLMLNDLRTLDKKKLPRMVDRFVSLGDENNPDDIANPELATDERNQNECLSRFDLDKARPILSICPGAEFGDAKKWPEAHYSELANYAIAKGMQVWIFGSPRDERVASDISAGVSGREHCHDLSGRTTLLDVVDLIALSSLVVSNDSGLMHIAAAVGCATTVIYGSTSPAFTPPLTGKLNIVSEELPCSPCFKRDCPLRHKDCLNNLQPGRIFPIIDSVLG